MELKGLGICGDAARPAKSQSKGTAEAGEWLTRQQERGPPLAGGTAHIDGGGSSVRPLPTGSGRATRAVAQAPLKGLPPPTFPRYPLDIEHGR